RHVYDFAALLDGSIDADLGRRDFTVNAMAVDLRSGALLDPHGGQRDLAARLVRMVDAANFDDDPLRMLKAIRMAVRLGFALVADPRAFAERWKWSDVLLRDVAALQRLASEHPPLALYDAGQRLAQQLPPMLRALGHDDAVEMPDFSVKPLLSGNEIARIAKI